MVMLLVIADLGFQATRTAGQSAAYGNFLGGTARCPAWTCSPSGGSLSLTGAATALQSFRRAPAPPTAALVELIFTCIFAVIAVVQISVGPAYMKKSARWMSLPSVDRAAAC